MGLGWEGSLPSGHTVPWAAQQMNAVPCCWETQAPHSALCFLTRLRVETQTGTQASPLCCSECRRMCGGIRSGRSSRRHSSTRSSRLGLIEQPQSE